MKYRYSVQVGVRKIKTKSTIALATVGLILGTGGLSLMSLGSAYAASCTPTGFIRDGMNLTAAQIGGNVTGTLDATGCNIGVYYNSLHPGNVSKADISGANYYGVVVDGGSGNVSVNVKNSTVHNIGETPFNGDQHGNAIYYYGLGTPGHVSGDVSNNQVSNYQKGGVIVNGQNATVDVHNNSVTGLGVVNYIAQNGIQFGYGAKGSAHDNTVNGNAYSGQNNASSCGILLFGGLGYPLTTNIDVHNNSLANNDIGVCLANYNASGSAGPTTPTNNDVHNNSISSDQLTNVSGNGNSQGYQAGISDSGNRDDIHNNAISGTGYAPQDSPSMFATPIDLSAPYSIHANSHNNTYDGKPV